MKNLSIVFLLCYLSFASIAQVQQDCGAIDCPGRCGRFVDQNDDKFCDHGRLSAPVSTSSETENATNTNDTPQTSQKAVCIPAAKKCIVKQNDTTIEIPIQELDQTEILDDESAKIPIPPKKPYNLILISVLTFGLYAVTSILVKTNVLKKAVHRKIWNILLLITALVSCLLGFFLVIQINYSLKMDWLWTVKLYHVQFGISMTIIAVIHILWHINYWKSYFKK